MTHGLEVRLELHETHARLVETQRKITADTAVRMGLVSADRDSTAFEYRRDGKLMYRKIRRAMFTPNGTIEKSYHVVPKNVTPFPFNWDSLNEVSPSQRDSLVISEGEFDAMAIAQAGETFVISVPNGASNAKVGEGTINPLNDGGFQWLWDGPRLHPLINAFDKVILAVDNDDKGNVLREELAVRIGKQRCFGVVYPEGCKDANDVLVKHGEQGLQDILLAAKPLIKDKLVPFCEIPQIAEPIQYVVWDDLREHLRINIPELMIVTGAPGSGKSTFALNVGAILAERYKWPGAILQFEDHPRRNFDDLVRFKMRNSINKKDINERGHAEIWANELFRTVAPSRLIDEEEDYTFKWLREAVWEAVKRHHAMWVIVDPWNEIEHVWSINESETRYTNEALRQMKRMARTYNILIIVCVHPTKQAGQQTDILEMSTYDAAGSAAWRNKADHGIIVYRPDLNVPESLVKIDKAKNHRTMGTPGIVRMHFDVANSQFVYTGRYLPMTG